MGIVNYITKRLENGIKYGRLTCDDTLLQTLSSKEYEIQAKIIESSNQKITAMLNFGNANLIYDFVMNENRYVTAINLVECN